MPKQLYPIQLKSSFVRPLLGSLLLLFFVISACTPSPTQPGAGFQTQAKADKPNPGKGNGQGQGQSQTRHKNRLPVATHYSVGLQDDLDNIFFLEDDPGFRTQAYVLQTACYDYSTSETCGWSALSANASYMAASWAPQSDSLSLDHPDLNTSGGASGYHFALLPLAHGVNDQGAKRSSPACNSSCVSKRIK